MTFHPRTLLAQRIYYGWVIVILCFLASVTVFGTSYAFSVFYDAFIEDFDASLSLLALVFGLQTALLYIAAVGSGRLVDKYGQRRVTAISSAILVVGLVWTAFAQSFLELLAAFGIVAAVGMAGLYIVSYATLPSWFEHRLGTAAGLASTGNGVGLIIIPPSANSAISAFGWRTAMLAVAFIVAIILLIVLLFFADDPKEVGANQRLESKATQREHIDSKYKNMENIRPIITSRSFLLVFIGWIFIFAPI